MTSLTEEDKSTIIDLSEKYTNLESLNGPNVTHTRREAIQEEYISGLQQQGYDPKIVEGVNMVTFYYNEIHKLRRLSRGATDPIYKNIYAHEAYTYVERLRKMKQESTIVIDVLQELVNKLPTLPAATAAPSAKEPSKSESSGGRKSRKPKNKKRKITRRR